MRHYESTFFHKRDEQDNPEIPVEVKFDKDDSTGYTATLKIGAITIFTNEQTLINFKNQLIWQTEQALKQKKV